MTKLEQVENEVRNLSPAELADFRHWIASYDAAPWDEKLESDVAAGRIDRLANEAVADHAAHRTQEL